MQLWFIVSSWALEILIVENEIGNVIFIHMNCKLQQVENLKYLSSWCKYIDIWTTKTITAYLQIDYGIQTNFIVSVHIFFCFPVTKIALGYYLKMKKVKYGYQQYLVR